MTSLDLSQPIEPQGGFRPGVPSIRMQIDARDLARIERMFSAMPQVIAKYMRDVFGQFAGSHRRATLAKLPPGLKRLARKSLFYSVRPKQKKVAVGSNIVTGRDILGFQALGGHDVSKVVRMEDIKMRIYSTSPVTLLHETGGVVTSSGKLMRIPITAGRKGIQARKRAVEEKDGAQYVALGKILFRVDDNGGKRKLVPVALLKRSITIKPALGIVATWNALEADRARRMQRALTAAADEIARTVGRSVGRALNQGLRGVA